MGQDHLLGAERHLGRMLNAGHLSSVVLWGPPGCGKTTIARLLADQTRHHFEPLSAVFSGVSDLRKVFDTARHRRQMGQGTVLFVDESHRFNRSQQDSFLPYVEDGTITLVGATTENPSFELNAALLSRMRVLVLHRLTDAALEEVLLRASRRWAFAVRPLRTYRLKAMADGDGRYLLSLVEDLAAHGHTAPLDASALATAVQRRPPTYDKDREGHYNLISALHKALRGSDPDAALYWCARMLEGGEDPGYILRRLVRFAVEDVGLADPSVLEQAVAAWEAYERLGSPEGDLAIAQLVVCLGTAPKSNAVYAAWKAARAAARASGSLPPPAHSVNAPTSLMKDLGYSAGYVYDHDTPEGCAGQNHFPDGMPRSAFMIRRHGVLSATSASAWSTGAACVRSAPHRRNGHDFGFRCGGCDWGRIGATLRYLVTTLVARLVSGSGFPWGTLLVNVLGSLLVESWWGLRQKDALSTLWQTFLFVGVLGGLQPSRRFHWKRCCWLNEIMGWLRCMWWHLWGPGLPL